MNNLKTKIIVTIGPASLNPQVFQDLITEGIDYIRINTAYGDERQYDLILANLKGVQTQGKVQAILDVKDLSRTGTP